MERHIKAEAADIATLVNEMHRVRSSHQELEERHAKLSKDYQGVLQKKVDRDRLVGSQQHGLQSCASSSSAVHHRVR